MPTIKGEPVNQKLEEIEEGIFKSKCYLCHHKNIKLVLFLEGERRSHNYASSCTNPDCHRHWKLKDIPSWRPA